MFNKISLITIGYYQLNHLLKHTIYNHYELFDQTPPIQFPPIFQTANIFTACVFSIFTLHLVALSKSKNYMLLALCLIYVKYTIDSVINFNSISLYEYECERTIMWLFTTPLILKIYSMVNNLTLMDINAHYHIAAISTRLVLYPFRNHPYNILVIAVLSGLEIYFIIKLFDFKKLKYTQFIIFIWLLFLCVNVLENTYLYDSASIQMCYLLSDMIAKLAIIVMVNDHEEQLYYIKTNVDLQTISLLSNIKKAIKEFETTYIITNKCKETIHLLTNHINGIIPSDKTTLKIELLKKILPLELEDNYLTKTSKYKEYSSICVLFTDIVSYTELAKKYDSTVIYKLLNEVYVRFDEIVLKYSNLQKIETIGDAYMVVGDIYNNDTHKNVYNIVLLALDFMKEIKKIPTPDNNPLQLRIGIHLGKVVVGILGSEIPRLCVIGNTVNVAARLQSTADPDTIQVSRHIYEFAEQYDYNEIDIQFILKENVYLKNLGTINTYVIKP
jgi:class 3 adenylate cyclase